MTRPILMYHAVDNRHDPMAIQVTPARLRRQLRTLRQLGFRGVSVRDMLASRPEERLVGLTFDDGYVDFATTAAPILAEFGFTATSFVVAGLVGDFNTWDPPPRRPLMTAADIRLVHRLGHEVAAHGMYHRRLDAKRPPAELLEEVADSKALLENMTQSEVVGFCYPYGAAAPDAVDVVRRLYGYGCAVAARPLADQWTLPRFHVGQADKGWRLAAKLALNPWRQQRQQRQRRSA
jgi:peptidoglycan/xylan/chitin deacetylase (PgdA/CDA1 family)